jgi:hypothetical protein
MAEVTLEGLAERVENLEAAVAMMIEGMGNEDELRREFIGDQNRSQEQYDLRSRLAELEMSRTVHVRDVLANHVLQMNRKLDTMDLLGMVKASDVVTGEQRRAFLDQLLAKARRHPRRSASRSG